MRSYLECIPCFFAQALRAGRMAGLSDEKIIEVFHELGRKLAQIKLSDSPPKTGKIVYGLVDKVSGKINPYAAVKAEHINLALKLLPELIDFAEKSSDKLDLALKISSAGNIIDLGALADVGDIHQTLKNALQMEHKRWDLEPLREKLAEAHTALVLGDNAGETVFDKILLTVITRIYPQIKIYYSVRSAPIINDATYEDAVASGIGEFAEIISTGSNAPGILLDEVSNEFYELFYKSDVIISKGQGNYETLNDIDREIFFLLTIKCDVVARHLHLPAGASVLLQNRPSH